ncbi:unnamed protein product [Prorocentrum cordatum]|uniref:Uncharacterized protein n=1 Tax=Prorocentrum cordatum TaxID=2364126 RepID=A0ABN9T1B3_9DINO|nr:unnamed protein product [Polarella glacialis]
MSQSVLNEYREQVQLYSQQYGQETWGIQYQADGWARRERLERGRVLGASVAAAATAGAAPLGGVAPVGKPYDLEKPCECRLRNVIEDARFWKREHEEQAVLVLARAARLGSMVNGDAPASSALAPQTGATGPRTPQPPQPPQRRGP